MRGYVATYRNATIQLHLQAGRTRTRAESSGSRPSVAIRSPTRSGSTSVEIAADARIAWAITSGGVSRAEYDSSKLCSVGRSVSVTSEAKTTSSRSASRSSAASAVRSPTRLAIVSGREYSCSPRQAAAARGGSAEDLVGPQLEQELLEQIEPSRGTHRPASAPDDVPKIQPTRSQSGDSHASRKPSSISTPLIAPSGEDDRHVAHLLPLVAHAQRIIYI